MAKSVDPDTTDPSRGSATLKEITNHTDLLSLSSKTYKKSNLLILCQVIYKNIWRGGGVVQWCWVNFQCRGVLLIWIGVGQGPTALAISAGWGCLDIFTLVYLFSFLSPSFWETARYRLKYCLKGR